MVGRDVWDTYPDSHGCGVSGQLMGSEFLVPVREIPEMRLAFALG